MNGRILRCPNGEFLLKIIDGERTVRTLVLTTEETESLWLEMADEFTAEQIWLMPRNIENLPGNA